MGGGPLFKAPAASRVIEIGRILRVTNIDELLSSGMS
jgi:lipopolysaccharide/colanic/teichoic acid biosynthesis glycosyltransferase